MCDDVITILKIIRDRSQSWSSVQSTNANRYLRRKGIQNSYKNTYKFLYFIFVVGPCLALVGNLVDNIVLSKVYFEVFQFSYVKNLCNKMNCVLATEALSSMSSQVWLEDCPDCIAQFVAIQ